ncbi:hypothetical protein H5410_008434 [Solanum commersonii]|uniref:Uncharacterized protein n=1 Tax=Solanum commersonii TaxID=4109 RepID=A0A9J6AF56_SOLCO|nr:hypothetical protein H5410_008434 [Solanum commersonii]
MANSSHVRSISFPSRSQPEYLRVEIELKRLKTWESTSISSTTTPFSLNTIQQGLVGLAELYNCVQDLLESPMIQQALLKHQMGRLAEEALEASVGLIDSCSTTRELVLMMKEQVQDLQSALRRKNLSYQAGQAKGQAQEKGNQMMDRAANAAQSARETIQEAGQQMQAKAQEATNAVKNATGLNK